MKNTTGIGTYQIENFKCEGMKLNAILKMYTGLARNMIQSEIGKKIA